MSAVNAQLVGEIQKRATRECIDLAMTLMDSQLGVGDHTINREDRIARFVDYAERGVLDALQGIGAPVYQTLVDEYIEDMMNSPYMTMAPAAQPYVMGAING